jgi:glycosyltransferase involved in cell wall biosynthesis
MRASDMMLAPEPALALPPLAPKKSPPLKSFAISDLTADQILIATINRPDGETGIHAHTRSLAEGMSGAGVKCEVISPFSGTRAWFPLFAVRPLLLKRINKTWSTRWHRFWHGAALERNLRIHLSRHLPRAIIAQCPVSARAALNARKAIGLNVPIIAVCHFNYSEASEYRDKDELRGQSAFRAVIDLEVDVLRSVDKVVYVSQWAQKMVEQDRGITPKSSAVIWNGIAGDATAVPVDRATLGLGEEDVVLINVGSLEPRKNQTGLLDLFARIADAYPAAKLLLVGEGPDRDAIEWKIGSLNLQSRVQCLGFRSDVPALLAASDLYIHYAKLENCPVVLLEAARAGVPAMTPPAGGAAEILTALQAGVLLNLDDLDKTTRSLSRLMTDAAYRREMGQKARAGFLDRFAQDAMAREYIRALQSAGASLASGRPAVAPVRIAPAVIKLDAAEAL